MPCTPFTRECICSMYGGVAHLVNSQKDWARHLALRADDVRRATQLHDRRTPELEPELENAILQDGDVSLGLSSVSGILALFPRASGLFPVVPAMCPVVPGLFPPSGHSRTTGQWSGKWHRNRMEQQHRTAKVQNRT